MPSRSAIAPADQTVRPTAPVPDWTPAGIRRDVGPPTVEALAKPLKGVAVDVLAVGMVAAEPGGPGPRVAVSGALPDPATSALEEAARRLRFSAKERETVRIPAPDGVPGEVVVLVGLGRSSEGHESTGSGADTDTTARATLMRRAAGAVARSVSSVKGLSRLAIVLPAADAVDLRAVAEGAVLGAYGFPWYRTRSGDDAPPAVTGVVVDTTTARAGGLKRKDLDSAVAKGTAAAESVWLARDLVNLAPVDLYPGAFADAARAVGQAAGFDVAVLDEQALVDGGYGGILAVGVGSSRPPRLVVCEYRPRRAAKDAPHVALVGKGITFDSGGLSLKPPASMPAMKSDMAGAAAVLGAIAAAARAQVPVRITAYLALAENMPSATAQRPSDVIRIRGGKTVEVLNTDAEGRLVMADAIVAAGEQEPDAVIDVATLTGAAIVALGSRTIGAFGTDDALVERIVAAGRHAGEPSWHMPLAEDLRAGLDSTVADIANVSMKRDGGMISAALFLREFVATDGDGRRRPWAHLDIAGPAFNESGAEDVTPKGGTGVPVRTLLALLESYS